MAVIARSVLAFHARADLLLEAVGRGLVVRAVPELVGEVLLRHPALGVVVRIVVARPVPELLRPLVVGVPEVDGHLDRRAVAHVLAGAARCRAADAVRLRRGGQVDDGLGQVELRLGQADVLDGVGGGVGDDERLGSATPTSSLARITSRRAMKRASSPASSMRASQ